MTRTTNDRNNAESLIRRCARQAVEEFDAAKARFAEAFATNPKRALAEHAEELCKAQTHHDWWLRFIAMLDRHGLDVAVRRATKHVASELKARIGVDGFCLWQNALRTCEVAIFAGTISRDLQRIRDANQV